MRSVYAPQTEQPDAPLAPVPSEILDQFVRQGPLSHEELEVAVRRFKKAIIERALSGELTHHLGYPPGGTKPEDTTNHRNGTGGKTVLTDDGPLAIAVPRDREGSFEPRFVAKHERRFAGFDDKILALDARGMTVREIQGFLAEMYGAGRTALPRAVIRSCSSSAARQDPRGSDGAQESGVPRAGGAARWRPGHARDLD